MLHYKPPYILNHISNPSEWPHIKQESTDYGWWGLISWAGSGIKVSYVATKFITCEQCGLYNFSSGVKWRFGQIRGEGVKWKLCQFLGGRAFFFFKLSRGLDLTSLVVSGGRPPPPLSECFIYYFVWMCFFVLFCFFVFYFMFLSAKKVAFVNLWSA